MTTNMASGMPDTSLIHEPLPPAQERVAQESLGLWGWDETQSRDRDRFHWLTSRIVGSRVLYIGCKEGFPALTLGREGFEVLGIDVDPEAVAYAEGLLAKEQEFIRKRVRFRHTDFLSPAVGEPSYDTVIVGELIKHLNKPDLMIERAFQFLKPGGQFLLCAPFGYLPDRKRSLVVSDVVDLLRVRCVPEHLSIVDGYIRFAGRREDPAPESWAGTDAELLKMTEEAAVESQRLLHHSLEFRKGSEAELRLGLEKQQKEIEAINRLKAGLEEKLNQLSSVMQLLQSGRDEFRTKLESVRSELDVVRKEFTSSSQKVHQLTRDLETLQDERDTIHEELSSVQGEREALQTRLDELLIERDRIGASLRAGGQEALRLAAARKALESERDSLKAELEALQSEQENLGAELKSVRQEADRLTVSLQTLESEREVLQEQLKISRSEKDKSGAQLRAARKKTDQLSASLKALESKRDSLQAKLDASSDQKNKIEEILRASGQEVLRLAVAQKTLESEKAALETQLEASRSESAALGAQLETFRSERVTLQARLETFQSEKEKLGTQLESAHQKADRLSTSLQALESERESLQAQLETSRSEKNELGAKLKSAHRKADQLSASLKSLESERGTLQVQLETSRSELKSLRSANKDFRQRLVKKSESRERAARNYYRTKQLLDETRQSFSFQLGYILTQSVARPGLNTLLMPYRLLRIILIGLKGLVKRTDKTVGSILIRLPNSAEKLVDFTTAKSESMTAEGQDISFTLSDGASAYLSSKSNSDFSRCPETSLFDLKPDTLYLLKGNAVLEGGSVTLWIIEYSDRERLCDHKLRLSTGPFTLYWQTHVEHRNVCLALRLSGRGSICLSDLKLSVAPENQKRTKGKDSTGKGPLKKVFHLTEAESNGRGEHRVELEDTPRRVTVSVEPEKEYRIFGEIFLHPDEKAHPALVCFDFKGYEASGSTSETTGLSLSDTVGLYSYLPTSRQDKHFAVHFKTPPKVTELTLGFRRWRSKKAVSLRNQIDLELLGSAGLGPASKAQIKKVSEILNARGMQAAEHYIEALDISDSGKSDLLEHLLSEVLPLAPQSSETVLKRAFELDPSYTRGKRLAQKAFTSGLIAEPARIVDKMVEFNPWISGNDLVWSGRIQSWGELFQSLPDIPPARKSPVYTPHPETSLMFLYFSPPHHSNGYATRSHGLLRSLHKSNWKVACYTRPGYPWDYLKDQNISEAHSVNEVVYRHLRGVDIFKLPVKDYLERSGSIIEAVARTNRASLIHAASNYYTALPALIAARRLGVPFIYEVRGLWEVTAESLKQNWVETDRYAVEKNLESLVAQQADAVLCITRGLQEELISRGVDPEKTFLVPNGVDVHQFTPTPQDKDLRKKLGLSEAPTIGFVGSFVAYEGLDDLIRAASQLKDKGLRFNLLLVGNGAVFEELKHLVSQLNLQDRVFMPGRVPHSEVDKYYSLIDIAPFPRKPLAVCEMVSPLKPFEAMAMEKPVVVSGVKALTEIVEHNRTGLIFEKGNVGDFVEKLAQLITDRSLADRIGRAGREWVERSRTWDAAAERMVDTYEKLTKKARVAASEKKALPVPSPNRPVRLAVYGDVNLNYIDGSAIWAVSLVQILAGLNNVNISFFLKAPEKRTLLTKPLETLPNVKLIRPHISKNKKPGMLTPEEALNAIQAHDKKDPFDAVILRGFNLCFKASSRKALDGRLWAYLTDIPQKVEDLTDDLKERLKQIISSAGYVLCQTEQFRSYLERNIPAAEGCTRILPPMIPTSANAPESGRSFANGIKRICYAGKFAPLWGTIEMIETFQALRDKHPGVELHVFGDKIHNPPDDPGFKPGVERLLNTTEGVVWHKGKSREEVLKHLPDMDVGWAWRKPELEKDTLELSTKVLEYGACGLPVILPVSNINDSLLGKDYPLFAHSIQEVQQLLESAWKAPEILEAARDRVYDAAQKFTYEYIRNHYLGPLVETLSGADNPAEPKRSHLPSIVTAGHDLKFFEKLGERFRENGSDVQYDVWWGHKYHDELKSRELIEKSDIIICEWCLGNAEWYSKNKRPGQKLIIRFHLQERESVYPERVDMSRIDRMIFVGPHIMREAVKRFGWEEWAEEKLTVIPNYVDVKAFDLPKEPGHPFNLGMAGIVPRRKRLDSALDILEILRSEDKRYRLHIKGRMPHEYAWMKERPEERLYYEEMMQRIKKTDLLKDAVHFDGWGDDMPRWYRKIGFILSTSDFESFHLSVAEGAASGAIPILLKWEGAEEIYPADWSYRNVDEAANAILKTGKSGDFDRTARTRYEYVKENFSIDRVFESWTRLLLP